MIGEVISIGDELTSGQRLDTNSQWLAERLGEHGVRVMYHVTVADDLEANAQVFRQAIERADIVVASGGLGPTADDLTREALARAANVELLPHEPSLAHIRDLFSRHGRSMPERNALQAMFPRGSRPIPNAQGTAPGIAIEFIRAGREACRFFALPGVPAEMREMFAQSVGPAISAAGGAGQVIRHRRIKCFGVGESQLEAMLPDLIARGREPSVGITVHAATITLRITARAATPDDCYRAMAPTVDLIRQKLGRLAFGEEDDELEDVAIRLLSERSETVSTVDGGTQGLLANWLCRAGRGTGAFAGGLVLPDDWNAVGAAELLEADERSGADHEATTAAMARRCRERFGTTCALSISPFPREDAALAQDAGDRPAEYYFALASERETICRGATLSSHATIWRQRAAKQALNLLRLALLGER